jgi:hypothetical protein
MTHFFAIITLTLALTANSILAFSSLALHASSRPSTQLRSTYDKERIKKSGAGITTKIPGDLCLYDPNEDGKMQGSNTLFDRIDRGASFALSVVEETPPLHTLVTLPPPAATTTQTLSTKPNIFSTNLTKLLKGELDARFKWERSQY